MRSHCRADDTHIFINHILMRLVWKTFCDKSIWHTGMRLQSQPKGGYSYAMYKGMYKHLDDDDDIYSHEK